MKDVKQEWQRTQLHWDDKAILQPQKVPKSVILNWRKINHILQELCREKKALSVKSLSMIDIGCGSGKIYDGLESAVELYVGIDPSDKMLSYTEKKQSQQFIRGVGENLPLKDGFADIVLLKSVLDQCYSPSELISESSRALRKGGWLIISLSNRNSYYASIRKLYNRLRDHEGEHVFEKGDLFYFDMNQVKSMLNDNGFNIIKAMSLGYFVFPKTFERIIPDGIFPKFIDIADSIGSFALPQRGGGFIIAGEKK